MARTVLTDTVTKLYRLRQRDLPDDLDLRWSFWRWVDLSSWDLSAYDMSHMDIIDCLGHDVILPPGHKMERLISRRTDWKGAKLPPDVSPIVNDFSREVLRVARTRLTGRSLAVTQAVYPMLSEGAHDKNSWWNIIHAGMAALNTTDFKEAFEIALPMFDGYLRMAARFQSYMISQRAGPNAPNLATDLTCLEYEARPVKRPEVQRVDIKAEVQGGLIQYDRWAAARMLEKLLAQRYPDIAPPAIYIVHLDPEPLIFAAGTNFYHDTEWWKDRWPE